MPTTPPPLPSLQKTWQFATNLNPGLSGSDATDHRNGMLLMINALLGFGSHPWVCAGSSDGTTAGMDGVNRITDITKIIQGGGPHSWIVLKQPQINANTSFCIDFGNNLNAGYINLFWSPAAGFTGGDTSNRPTATDEQFSVFAGGGQFQFFNGWNPPGNGPGMSMRLHVMQSTDGQCTRIFLAQAHTIRTVLLFDKPGSPVTGWANPAIAWMSNQGSIPMQFDHWFARGIQALGPVTQMPMYPCFISDSADTINWFPWALWSEWDQQFQMYGLGMYHDVTAGQRGRHGYIFDMWAMPTIPLTGTSLPSNGSKQFILMGNFAFPWNGGDIEMG